MEPKYGVRLMFEWGGGVLWCGDDAARERFGVGPIEDLLPLSTSTRGRLEELSAWHDGALDWDDPAGPNPWRPEEVERFGRAVHEVLEVVRRELGAEFEVVYVEL
ncbi:MAG TPA: hypothetical protein VF263_05155 [Longimicrobiaceae bacterium]